MIEGLQLDFTTDELAVHFAARVEHHDDRISFYRRQVRQLEEGGAQRSEYTGGDPVDSLKRSLQSHQARRDLLAVMAGHLVPGETYRLTESDLARIELIDRAY